MRLLITMGAVLLVLSRTPLHAQLAQEHPVSI